jgi:hypothetical protein
MAGRTLRAWLSFKAGVRIALLAFWPFAAPAGNAYLF